jgi:hypothetical protein
MRNGEGAARRRAGRHEHRASLTGQRQRPLAPLHLTGEEADQPTAVDPDLAPI